MIRNWIICPGIFTSCHSEDPIHDILGEASRNREVPDRQGLTLAELTSRQKTEDSISGNQIVIRVTDTDTDTKGYGTNQLCSAQNYQLNHSQHRFMFY